MKPNVSEFKKFYTLLMKSAPANFLPHLFPLEIGGKNPLSTRGSWIAEKNRLSFEEAARFMSFGYNIGIAALSTDELTLVDVDNMLAIPSHEIKPTLSVTTRSRVGSHSFYFSDDPKCIVNIPTNHGEIRSHNQYLVTCGSYVSTDCSSVPKDQKEFCGYYTIHNPVAPASITFDEFPKVFRDHVEAIKNLPPRSPPTQTEFRSKSALFSLTIDDVISYPKNKHRFPSPFHGSESGANAAASNGLIHCFRHLVAHNPIQALSVLAGMYTCQEAGVSHANGGSGASMLDLRDGETLYNLWWYARHEKYIPAGDPPPNAALRYFVVETGICKEEDIEDGWRVPTYAYREAIHLLSTNI